MNFGSNIFFLKHRLMILKNIEENSIQYSGRNNYKINKRLTDMQKKQLNILLQETMSNLDSRYSYILHRRFQLCEEIVRRQPDRKHYKKFDFCTRQLGRLLNT